MATMKRRAASRSSRRTRMSSRSRRASDKSRTLSPSDFRGRGAISSARRSIAKGARKVTPKLNRELV